MVEDNNDEWFCARTRFFGIFNLIENDADPPLPNTLFELRKNDCLRREAHNRVEVITL